MSIHHRFYFTENYFDVSCWRIWYLPSNNGNNFKHISLPCFPLYCVMALISQIQWLIVLISNYKPFCSSLNPQNRHLINDHFPCFFDLHTLTKQSYGELGKTESNSCGKQETESTAWATQALILNDIVWYPIDKEKSLGLCFMEVVKRLDEIAAVLSSFI